ncbi:MAG: autotransporter domain-containing protein [Sphingomonadales bacterium]|nr:autotransporter domain-containing protein [Sphingomonadales bacterium]
MNRTKSNLLAATALVAFAGVMLAAPQVAKAQSEPASVVFLPRTASQPSASCIVPAVAETGTSANTMSGDGQIVVGFGNRSACANAWRNGVPQLLNDPNTTPTAAGIVQASSANIDGSIIVGDARGTGFGSGYNQTTIWTAATGFYNPPEVVAGSRQALGAGYVNANGTYLALNVSDYSRNAISGDFSQYSGRIAAYRWSPVNGYEAIGSLGSRYDMIATGIDGAGSTIAGTAIDPSTGTDRIAFVWRSASGLASLSHLSNNPAGGVSAASTAEAISRNGTTIVGRSLDANGFSQAAFWRNGTVSGLGFLPGLSPSQTGLFADNATKAQAVNADGSIIVGTTGSGFQNPASLAWRWTSASGMQDLNLFATNAGVNLGGFVLTDAVGLSDNGQYITGNSFNAAQSQSRGYVLSIAAAPPPTSGTVSFLPADAGGTFTTAKDISSDGSFVAGSSDFDINLFGNAHKDDGYFLWRNSALLTQTDERDNRLTATVPLSATNASQAVRYRGYGYARTRVSGDGQTVIMRNASPRPDEDPSLGVLPNFRQSHVIWTAQRGPFVIAPPTGVTFVSGQDVNYDGSVLLFADGYVQRPAQANGQVIIDKSYRWTAEGGFQDIGQAVTDLTPDPAALRKIGVVGEAISGDGNTIAGNWYDTRIGLPTLTALPSSEGGFRWTASSGLQKLPHLSASPLGVTITNDPSSSGPYSSVSGISRDGATIVGQSRGSNGLVQATYWREGTATGLGFLTGFTPTETARYSKFATNALAASADGSVIVGQMENSDDGSAWRWSSSTGMQDLNVLATNAGINLNGFTLADAASVSDNGQFITGTAFKRASDGIGLLGQFGYVLSIGAAPITPTSLTTSARLIVTLTLPGVTQTSIVNQTFSTQVDAVLNGSNLFTRTVGDQITGTLGVTALADARTALQRGSGLRRVVIGAPVLVSNTTTVLSSSSNTVNVASGTQVTTAAVVTNGPATVATGDLGTCATAATDGVNPTGCSLPGTPVAVNANVINTNSFTNTINSVTPTTTTTVNQLISAKWQVSATAGNQFGTVHALVGPAAFDRGDRLIGQLLGMGGGQGESANRVTRATMPMRNANALGGEGRGLTMFGGYFGSWSHIDADPTVPVASVKGRTNGFVMGLEKGLGAGRIGVAVDHGTSDYSVRDATYPETLKFNHTQLALFAGWTGGGFSLNGAAAYGFGTAKTSLAMPVAPATAKRDVHGWSLGAQAGYTVPLGKAASVELVSGVRHTSANLKAFTETGGPSPLLGRDQTVTRTRVYGGIEAEAGFDLGGLTLTPRLHARVAHDSGDARGTADLVFASAPTGPVMTAVGPGVGRTVAELGGSLDAAMGGNVHLWVGYDGTFRNGAKAHAAKAGVTVAF